MKEIFDEHKNIRSQETFPSLHASWMIKTTDEELRRLQS